MNIIPLINEITNSFNESLRAPRFNIEKKNAAISLRFLFYADVFITDNVRLQLLHLL